MKGEQKACRGVSKHLVPNTAKGKTGEGRGGITVTFTSFKMSKVERLVTDFLPRRAQGTCRRLRPLPAASRALPSAF